MGYMAFVEHRESSALAADGTRVYGATAMDNSDRAVQMACRSQSGSLPWPRKIR